MENETIEGQSTKNEMLSSENDGVKESKKKIKGTNHHTRRSFIIFFVILFAVVMCVHSFLVQQVEVSGTSMEPTLQHTNRLLLEKYTYYNNEPKRFDIIVFTAGEGARRTQYIKRVIGLPGEKVRIKKGKVYINGENLEEHYGLEEEILDAGLAQNTITLGEDEYFTLGDNRENSVDSRHVEVSAVNKKQIDGRAWIRIWPLTRMGILKHQ